MRPSNSDYPHGHHSGPVSPPQINGYHHEPAFLSKHMLDRLDQVVTWMHSIDRKIDLGFQAGDYRMGRIEAETAALKTQPPVKASAAMPGWEVALKRPMPWIIGLVALAATGKLDVAVRLVEALLKIAAAVK